jgi:hypothetical protein
VVPSGGKCEGATGACILARLPSSQHANRLLAHRLADRLLTVALHNPSDAFLDYARNEIGLALDAASKRGGQ